MSHRYQIRITPCKLTFKQPAGTSRGVYTDRQVWYIHLHDTVTNTSGTGECAPLPDLSCDAFPDYGDILEDVCRKTALSGMVDTEYLRHYPSILFGLETAFRHVACGSYALWDTPFSRHEKGIPINGLIWMGQYDMMLKQIENKLDSGFRCIKLKIGAIGFEEEISLLHHIRRHFTPEEVEIRVDANGAFRPETVLNKLDRLAALGIHSIEQPIPAGDWEAMADLTGKTPLPIALDEELIGINGLTEKRNC